MSSYFVLVKFFIIFTITLNEVEPLAIVHGNGKGRALSDPHSVPLFFRDRSRFSFSNRRIIANDDDDLQSRTIDDESDTNMLLDLDADDDLNLKSEKQAQKEVELFNIPMITRAPEIKRTMTTTTSSPPELVSMSDGLLYVVTPMRQVQVVTETTQEGNGITVTDENDFEVTSTTSADNLSKLTTEVEILSTEKLTDETVETNTEPIEARFDLDTSATPATLVTDSITTTFGTNVGDLDLVASTVQSVLEESLQNDEPFEEEQISTSTVKDFEQNLDNSLFKYIKSLEESSTEAAQSLTTLDLSDTTTDTTSLEGLENISTTQNSDERPGSFRLYDDQTEMSTTDLFTEVSTIRLEN